MQYMTVTCSTHKVLRSPALRRARLWFWNICPLFPRQEPWKQTGTGNADFCAWLGTPLPWIRTQTKNESGTNAEQDRHVLTAIPPILDLPRHSVRYGKGCFWLMVLSTAPGSSGFFYHIVVSTDNLDFRLWSAFLRNKNIPFYFKYDRFRKKSFSHIKKMSLN